MAQPERLIAAAINARRLIRLLIANDPLIPFEMPGGPRSTREHPCSVQNSTVAGAELEATLTPKTTLTTDAPLATVSARVFTHFERQSNHNRVESQQSRIISQSIQKSAFAIAVAVISSFSAVPQHERPRHVRTTRVRLLVE